jgi:hypothetical protein
VARGAGWRRELVLTRPLAGPWMIAAPARRGYEVALTYHNKAKRAGETALRARQPALAERGVRLLVVIGDLVEGTISPRLLERMARGLAAGRREASGPLPTAADTGETIAAATEPALPGGHTVVMGASFDSLARRAATHPGRTGAEG